MFNMADVTISTQMFVFLLLMTILCVTFANVRLKPAADLERIKRLNDKYASMIEVKGGKFKQGVNDPRSRTGEYPPREKKVRDFYIDLYPVTVSQYRKFKQNKTKYRTDAERKGWSYVFQDAVRPNLLDNSPRPMPDQPFMLQVEEAAWNRPEGPGSTTVGRMNYPLVHVTHNDAHLYCQWAGKRLPTETEWEFAARGGLKEQNYPWGDRFKKKRMNYWQGKFPHHNKVWDEWQHLSPVDAFPPQNEYGMYDMMGNVWEWTTTPFYQRGVPRDKQPQRYVVKGGSFISTRDGDDGTFVVRSSTRRGLEPDYSAQDVGFRCAVTSPHIPAAGEKVEQPKKPRRVHKVHEMHDQRAAREMNLKRKALREEKNKARSTSIPVRIIRDEF